MICVCVAPPTNWWQQQQQAQAACGVRYQCTAVKNRAEAALPTRHQATACSRVRCGLGMHIYAVSPHKHTHKRCCNQSTATRLPDQPARQDLQHTPHHSTFLHPLSNRGLHMHPARFKAYPMPQGMCSAGHASKTQKEQTAMRLLRASTQSCTHCLAARTTSCAITQAACRLHCCAAKRGLLPVDYTPA